MKVYLDNCVFQALKRPENIELLEAIKSSKGEYLYFFSEAHLQDLSRDESDEKLKDLLFMECTVDNNCLWFYEKELFEYYTPTDCYNRFNWPKCQFNDVLDLFSDDYLKQQFEALPLNFLEFISLDNLPKDCPDDLIDFLTKPTNFYEFFVVFFDLVSTLSLEQKRFKKLLQYLHNNSLSFLLFEKVGIKGYDGIKIVDREVFKESLANINITNVRERNLFEKYTDTYVQLEIFGIVPGKPKKQGFMNLINDAKHSFYGRNCDFVVSIDVDFINKSKFLYELYEIDTIVCDVKEFNEYLKEQFLAQTNHFDSLINEITKGSIQNSYSLTNENNGSVYFVEKLSRKYLGYFDEIIRSTEGDIFITKNIDKSYFKHTMFKEIEHCANLLYDKFGEDINSKVKFEFSPNGEWTALTWIICEGKMEMNLIYDSKIYLIFKTASNN